MIAMSTAANASEGPTGNSLAANFEVPLVVTGVEDVVEEMVVVLTIDVVVDAPAGEEEEAVVVVEDELFWDAVVELVVPRVST